MDEKPQISIGTVHGDSVISQNQTGGITAHTVNIGTPTRRITVGAAEELKNSLKRLPALSCELEIIAGDSEARVLAATLTQVLQDSGWQAGVSAESMFPFIPRNLIIEYPANNPAAKEFIDWARRVGLKPDARPSQIERVHIIVGTAF